MGEAINLVENFKVQKVIFNCGEFNELEKELIKTLDKKKILYYSCIKELNISDNKLYFLNNKDYGNENDNSSVIYTELNNHKFLFMGDAGVEVEEDLIEKYNLKNIEVLKVGHHGSETISSKNFIDDANPKKNMVALGQTYFAIQTRKQELNEKEYSELTEDEKRLYRRNQARKGNYNLNQTAVKRGVQDLARFHNAGYKGLYNDETADDIFKRKKLRYREDILDNMGSEELADNIFRIVQTDAKLKRDNLDNEYTTNSVHFEVGREVRDSMGGTMPENLPTPSRSLKELENESKKLKE